MRNSVTRKQLLQLLNEIINDPDRLYDKLSDREKEIFDEYPFKYGVLKRALELLIDRLQ